MSAGSHLLEGFKNCRPLILAVNTSPGVCAVAPGDGAAGGTTPARYQTNIVRATPRGAGGAYFSDYGHQFHAMSFRRVNSTVAHRRPHQPEALVRGIRYARSPSRAPPHPPLTRTASSPPGTSWCGSRCSSGRNDEGAVCPSVLAYQNWLCTPYELGPEIVRLTAEGWGTLPLGGGHAHLRFL